MANLVGRSPQRQVARIMAIASRDFRQIENVLRQFRAVVQLGRTLEWGSRGRGFESRRPDLPPFNYKKSRLE